MKPKAAPAVEPRYPRLNAGWRVLLGAALVPSLASADVTPPKPGNAATGSPAGNSAAAATPAKKAPCPLSAEPATKASKARPKPTREPRLLGELGYHVGPPQAPVFHASLDGDTVIHAHGPDEPCKVNA
jgi:hypothetical protein